MKKNLFILLVALISFNCSNTKDNSKTRVYPYYVKDGKYYNYPLIIKENKTKLTILNGKTSITIPLQGDTTSILNINVRYDSISASIANHRWVIKPEILVAFRDSYIESDQYVVKPTDTYFSLSKKFKIHIDTLKHKYPFLRTNTIIKL